MSIRNSLIFIPFLLLAFQVSPSVARAADEENSLFQVEMEDLDLGLHRVADPRASGGTAVAFSMEKDSGRYDMELSEKLFLPGRYRVAIRLRSPMLNEVAVAEARAALSVLGDEESLSSRDSGRFSFSDPDEYEEMSLEVHLKKEAPLSVTYGWSRDRKDTALAAVGAAPTLPKAGEAGQAEATGGEDLEAGTIELELNEIKFPCLLADRVTVRQIGGDFWIERVWPEKVYCRPGDANPIEVKVVNAGKNEKTGLLRVEMVTGIDDRSLAGEKQVTVAPGNSESVQFDWRAGDREFGHEVAVQLVEDGKTVDARSEYFSVNRNIWEVSIQAPGFLSWVWGRPEGYLENMVNEWREAYMNVVEAFSWAPCSFSDLTPDTDQWWSGQNSYHCTLVEGKRWFQLCHEQGIQMITYSWPAASGPIGMEFARQHPDWISNQTIGLGMEFKVRDLRWQEWARKMGKPFLAPVGRVWHAAGTDRGRLAAIDYGAREILASAKMLGWDGVRFDMPWGWSPMGGEGVHQEFEQLGIVEEAKRLFPNLYGKKETWTGDEVSLRNIRWTKHLISKDRPDFVYSYNWGVPFLDGDNQGRAEAMEAYREACAGGGQIMNEVLKHYHTRTWKVYADQVRREADFVRSLGGHYVAVAFAPPKPLGVLTSTYMKIFTLAGRAHPYNDYGWSNSVTGTYAQFATRHSELLWHPDWKPLKEAQEIFELESSYPVWWEEHAAIRDVGKKVQILVHLITEPPMAQGADNPKTVPPWQKNVKISFKGYRDRKRVRAVYGFSPEPQTRSFEVKMENQGESAAAVVPEHHYWTMVLWEIE